MLWLARKLTIRGKNAPGRNGEKILCQPFIATIHIVVMICDIAICIGIEKFYGKDKRVVKEKRKRNTTTCRTILFGCARSSRF